MQRNPSRLPAGVEGTFILARQPARYCRQAVPEWSVASDAEGGSGERGVP